MSFTREITIFCDKCGDWERVTTAKVSTARREVKIKGWRYMKDPEIVEAGFSVGSMIDVLSLIHI